MEFLRFGNMSDTLSALQSCYQLRAKAMYAHHIEVTEVADQLAKCYAMMGSFSESAQYLKVCMPAIQERYCIKSIIIKSRIFFPLTIQPINSKTSEIFIFQVWRLQYRGWT